MKFVKVIEHIADSDLHTALDIIYDTFDNLAHQSKFKAIDSILLDVTSNINENKDLLLGYLTASLPMKNKLFNRALIVHVVKNLYPDLIEGLE